MGNYPATGGDGFGVPALSASSVVCELAVWFCALDYTNYGRWIPVHLLTTHTGFLSWELRRPEDKQSILRHPCRSGPRAEQCYHQRRSDCSPHRSTTVDGGRTRGCRAHQTVPR